MAWIRTLQPTRAKGVLLKLNGPLKYSQTDIFEFIVAWCSRLTVNLAWGRRRSQRYGRNAALTPARMERKWFLKCHIIRLALFLRCMSGGTSWNLAFHDSVMTRLKSAPWLGIPIFGSDFRDPHCKRNSDSVFDSKNSGGFFFEIPMSGQSENWNSDL